MLKAYSLQTKALIKLPGKWDKEKKALVKEFRLERRDGAGGLWLALTDTGFDNINSNIKPVGGLYLDEYPMDGICQYRARDFNNENAAWDYTPWLRRGNTQPVGYTFGNYKAPDGSWGEILTTDDMRGYLWGIDFRASNGEPYTDEQIKFFIDAAMEETERILNITIKKTRIASEPERRNLVKGKDYDVAEPYYKFKRERVQLTGMINTKKRPLISVSKLDLLSRHNRIIPMLESANIDRTKGRIEFLDRPLRMGDTTRAVQTAMFPYGAGTFERNLFYAIDYVAGFETSDDVPTDLREFVGKKTAVSLMNIIGRGLMAGFSSSSISMDGVSESFSSTQCATSAFYGADIKEYKDDIETYIAENRNKFGFIVMGSI